MILELKTLRLSSFHEHSTSIARDVPRTSQLLITASFVGTKFRALAETAFRRILSSRFQWAK